jgi:hypothetical protein
MELINHLIRIILIIVNYININIFFVVMIAGNKLIIKGMEIEETINQRDSKWK